MRPNAGLVFLIALFLITNFLGLWAASHLQEVEAVQDAASEHQSAVSGVYFFALIGLSTIVLLALYKYNVLSAVHGWFTLALFMSTLIFFDVFLSTLAALAVTVTLLLVRYKTNDPMLQNALTVFAFAGAGAFLGSIIGFQAVLVLLVLLSVYDYFSVNISQHMIDLAKSGMQSNTFMGFTYPKKEGGIPVAELQAADEETDAHGGTDDIEVDAVDSETMRVGILGGGDIVIPLTFAAAALPTYGVAPAAASIFGAAAGLTFLLTRAQEGKFYPAIPPVAIGSVAGFGLMWVLLNVVPTVL